MDKQVAIIELGAGTRVQTIRFVGEKLLDRFGPEKCTLIRINPAVDQKSIFPDRYIEFINEENIGEERKSDDKRRKLQILHIQAGA